MTTIKKTINQPVEVINTFADRLGYTEVIPNPDYVPAQGVETIIDPTYEGDLDAKDVPTISNPDYVPAVGEPTIPNDDRVTYVSGKVDELVESFFTQFAELDARQAAEATIQATVEATKQAIHATISTEII